MKKPDLKINYIYNLAYEVLAIIAPLITTPYIARVLAVESIGIYSFTYSMTLYYTAFIALGTKSYAIKRIAQAKTDNDSSKLFFEVLSLRCMIGCISIIIYSGQTIIYAQNKNISFAQMLYLVACIFDISWFFQGKENFRIIVFRNAVIKILTIVLIFAFVRTNNDLFIYTLILSGLTLIGNLSMWFALPRYVNLIPVKEIRPFRGMKEILVLFIPTLALQIHAAVDKTMIGTIINNYAQNGYYEQAHKIVGILLTVITSLSIVALPHVSSLIAEKKQNEVTECMRKSFHFVLMTSIPMAVGLCGISDWVIPWFLGNQYMPCIEIVNILSILFFVMGMSNITGFQYLVAIDKQSIYSASIVAGTVVNILSNLILIPKYQAIGAALATVLSESVVLFIQLFYVITYKKLFSFKMVFGCTYKYIISAGVMFMCMLILKELLNGSFVNIVFVCILCSLIYFMLLILFKDSMLRDAYFKLKSKIKRG